MEDLFVLESQTMLEALERLNTTARGILLLVDGQGRLVRTVTDGDIRRFMLTESSLDAPLSRLPAKPPKTGPVDISRQAALELLNEYRIDHLPLVDPAGRIVSLLHRRDIDSPILLSSPHISDQEQTLVADAFRSNWIAPLGPHVDGFEADICAWVGGGHAAATSSGTAAIHLALRLLGVGPGDEVFCSSLTFVASANPILYQGATPVFIDCEPESWNMSPPALEAAFREADRRGQLPRAVIVVNLYGQSADVDRLLAICDRYGVPVVEDAAESLGATYRGRASGSFGKLGVFSFNGNKIITTSGGGMLIGADRDLIEKARFLSTQARDPAPYYQHSELGYNYRMSNVLAAIGRGQLRVLPERVEARRRVFQNYAEGLAHVRAIRWMPEADYGRSTRWLTACVLDKSQSPLSPEELIAALAAERIEARRVWKPLHRQPLFAGCRYFPHEEGRSVSDELFERGVCLPSGSNLTQGQQSRIIHLLNRLLRPGTVADQPTIEPASPARARKRILFVTYGAGHVNMVIPVARRLLEDPSVDVSVLGLTTAGNVLEAAGIPSFGFRHVLRADDCRAREAGERLAAALGPGPVCHEETVAYLGLSYVDLETRLGPEEAARRYALEGRHAFLPLTVLERVIRERRPDLVVATSSPRAERAAIEAARRLGVPAVCLVDLFAILEGEWVAQPGYANRVCVLNDYVKQLLVRAGRRASDVVITGNPVFDALAQPEIKERARELKRARGWDRLRTILWASQVEPARHPLTGQTGNPNLPRSVEQELLAIVQRRPDWGVIIRPHPNERVTRQDLPERAWFSGREDHLPTLLRAVDVVLVMSSTVGLEAALLGRPVAQLQASITTGDCPYVDVGIALGVPSVACLEERLARILSGDWRPSTRLPEPGRATNNVVSVIEEVLGLAGASRKRMEEQAV
jgi:dTDP-4-amino-4,6-dideoxygalactose transaminase